MTEDSKSTVDVVSVANEIAHYLKDHQQAADTVEGICHWWIAKQRIQEEQARVLAALDYLIEKKVIVRRQLPDGSALYTANTENTSDKFKN